MSQSSLPLKSKVAGLVVVLSLFLALSWLAGQLLFAIEPPVSYSKETTPEQLFVVIGRSEKPAPDAFDLRSIQKKAISVDGVRFLLEEDIGEFHGAYGDTKFVVEHLGSGVQRFSVVTKNSDYVAYSTYLADASGITPLESKLFTLDYMYRAVPFALFATLMICLIGLKVVPTKLINQRRAPRTELPNPL